MSYGSVSVLFIVLLHQLYLTDGVPFTCSEKEFGVYPDCFRCRCRLVNDCNPLTGECKRGCAPGWMGNSCQYGNIAYGRNVTMNGYPNRQITDGTNLTCSFSSIFSIVNVRMSINLENYYHVERMQIHFSFNGYVEVYVGDGGTDRKDICYLYTSYARRVFSDVICFRGLKGKFITVLLKGRIHQSSRFCEVSVYGGQDVAYGQQTLQKDVFYHETDLRSHKAVDGNITTSTQTNSRRNAWWYVQLSDVYKLNWIQIYNRPGPTITRVDGFQLTVLKYGDVMLIYNETKDNHVAERIDIPLIPQVYGNKIQIRLEGGRDDTYLQLNEVEVYAVCTDKRFGISCSKKCNCYNESEICDKIDGGCSSGCSSGFVGKTCQNACQKGMFGRNCSQSCNKCHNMDCEHIKGQCNSGCITGYRGKTCETPCSKETYGWNCSLLCPMCLSKECHHLTGACIPYGCVPGYTGSTCSKACVHGKFGNECLYNCNCYDPTEACDNGNGYCESGCRGGYRGTNCLQASSEKAAFIAIIVVLSVALVVSRIVVCALALWEKRNSRKKTQRETEESNANERVMFINDAFSSTPEVYLPLPRNLQTHNSSVRHSETRGTRHSNSRSSDV